MGRNKPKRDKTLRIPGVIRGKKIRLTVDGRPVTAHEGETVHAALTAAGIKGLKNSRSSQPRGVFCGMGICYECLVQINGLPDQRACMTLAEDQMEVYTHEG